PQSWGPPWGWPRTAGRSPPTHPGAPEYDAAFLVAPDHRDRQRPLVSRRPRCRRSRTTPGCWLPPSSAMSKGPSFAETPWGAVVNGRLFTIDPARVAYEGPVVRDRPRSGGLRRVGCS